MSHPLLTNLTPAAGWRDGSPLGNGTIGAMVYGRVADERVLLNHEDLWYDGNVPKTPDVAGTLSELRRLMSESRYAEANATYPDALRAAGWDGRTAQYHPAGALRLHMSTATTFRDYRRSLDLATGRCDVVWNDGETRYERSAFVSRPDGLFVMRISASHDASVSCDLHLAAHDLHNAIDPRGQPLDVPIDFASRVEGDRLHLTGRYRPADGQDTKEPGGFGTVARVVARGGKLTHRDDRLHVEAADEVLIVARLYTCKGCPNEPDRRTGETLAAETRGFEQLFLPHAQAHRELFSRTTLTLGAPQADTPIERLLLDAYEHGHATPQLTEKMIAFGRYLLIASAGRTPSHLQGIWNGDYQPPWACIYMANENLQMNYWQALPGALPELVRGVFDFYHDRLQDFRDNARQLFGCGGLLIPALITPPTGRATNIAPHIIYWVSAAGWLAQHFVDHWRATGDDAFLHDRLLPFLVEVAHFYEDFLVEGDDGLLHICPSTSPENTPAEFIDPEHLDEGSVINGEVRLTRDATMDVAIARELLGNLIELSKHAGQHDAKLSRWQSMLDRLPAYRINDRGAIREWLDPAFSDHDAHRHLSHLYPFFPGTQITPESDAELTDACRTAVKNRLVVGLDQQTGWSLAHMANIFARFGEGDSAQDCLDTLARTCLGQNLLTYHNDYRGMGATLGMIWGHHPPFQIDANMGWTAAAYEMLLFSAPGLVRLAPALPGRWPTGKVTGLRTRCRVSVDLAWDQNAGRLTAELTSDIDQPLAVRLPHPPTAITIDGAQAAPTQGDECALHITLTKGKTLSIAAQMQSPRPCDPATENQVQHA